MNISRTLSVLVTVSLIAVCSLSQQAARDQGEDSAILHLQALPAANPQLWKNVRTADDWQNPYLIIRTNYISVHDLAAAVEFRIKPENLLVALTGLPQSAWPYGRAVAVLESGVLTSKDKKPTEDTRALVARLLRKAKIEAIWIPPA